MELWVELGWNYMKFHPNSTHNSTIPILLITNNLTYQGWKGGITLQEIFFRELDTKSSKIMLISGTNTGNMITSLAIKNILLQQKESFR